MRRTYQNSDLNQQLSLRLKKVNVRIREILERYESKIKDIHLKKNQVKSELEKETRSNLL